MATVVQVDGAARLRRELKRAGVDLADLTEAHRDAAQTVAAAAGPRTPRRTGRLASTVRPGGTRTAAVVRAGGARAPYAAAVHYGVPSRNIAAQPWLVDAAYNTEDAWVGDYMDALDAILARIAGGP